MSFSYKLIPSPIGKLKLVASDDGLVAILWENDNPRRVRLADLVERPNHPILLRTEKELGEYFTGTRDAFSVPLDMRGTPFQKSVWEALLAIPFGETRIYGQLAKQLGNPKATRAPFSRSRNQRTIDTSHASSPGHAGSVQRTQPGSVSGASTATSACGYCRK